MHRALTQTAVPAIEPVTLTQAKEHLIYGEDDQDSAINLIITVARREVEKRTGHRLINQTWTMKLPHFPSADVIVVPYSPLSSVTSITYIDTAGDSQTWSSGEYDVDKDSTPGRIALAYGESYPSTRTDINAVTVTFVCGYGTAIEDVPAEYRQAILLIVGDLFENRSATSEIRLETNRAIDSLLSDRILEVA